MEVQPTDPAAHDVYEFYLKVSARGGSYGFFGRDNSYATSEYSSIAPVALASKFRLIVGCVESEV